MKVEVDYFGGRKTYENARLVWHPPLPVLAVVGYLGADGKPCTAREAVENYTVDSFNGGEWYSAREIP